MHAAWLTARLLSNSPPPPLHCVADGDNLVDSGTATQMFPGNDRLRFPFRCASAPALCLAATGSCSMLAW